MRQMDEILTGSYNHSRSRDYRNSFNVCQSICYATWLIMNLFKKLVLNEVVALWGFVYRDA